MVGSRKHGVARDWTFGAGCCTDKALVILAGYDDERKLNLLARVLSLVIRTASKFGEVLARAGMELVIAEVTHDVSVN